MICERKLSGFVTIRIVYDSSVRLVLSNVKPIAFCGKERMGVVCDNKHFAKMPFSVFIPLHSLLLKK